MNKYQEWYTELMVSRKNRETDVYSERHHITPRALGGGNNKANIVRLTYREHFLAHWLLTKFTTGENRRKMFCALHSMMTVGLNHPQRLVAGWQYEIARSASRNAKIGIKRPNASIWMKGNQNTKGRKLGPRLPLTLEHRTKMSIALSGRKRPDVSVQMTGNKYSSSPKNLEKLISRNKSLENRNKVSLAMKGNKYGCGSKNSGPKKGYKQTPEHRAKISAARRHYFETLSSPDVC